jgi:glycosidase
VCDQESDPGSLLNVVRRLAHLRKAHSALCGDGEFIPLFAEPDKYPFVYQREDASGAFVIAINPSARRAHASFCKSSSIGPLRQIDGGNVKWRLENGRCELEMPAISYAIFECAALSASGEKNICPPPNPAQRL